jgi:hypothetical protein
MTAPETVPRMEMLMVCRASTPISAMNEDEISGARRDRPKRTRLWSVSLCSKLLDVMPAAGSENSNAAIRTNPTIQRRRRGGAKKPLV